MKKSLRFTKISVLLVAAISMSLTACGSTGPKGGAAPVQAGDESKLFGLSKTETPDELYEKAKKEGKVVVYSPSARANDAKKTFEAKYPGITVEVFKLKSNDLMDKLIKEQDAGLFNADVIITKEVSGAVGEEMVKPGRVYKYLPEDIAPNVDEPFRTKDGYANYLEMRTLYYNTEAYKSAPVSSWWDLTTPEWTGKVYLVDPLSSPAFMDLFTGMVVNSDDMKKAYKDKFGKEIELHGTENAGYEFIKRLRENKPVVLKGSGDVLDAIGKAGTKSQAVGVAVSGDERKIEDDGLKVAPIYDIKPKTSVPDAGYVYMAQKAPHEYAGKLFIRWMMGEKDGKGAGVEPFNELGSWVPRSDVKSKNAIPYEKLNMWTYEAKGFYTNSAKVRDFWIKLK
ncbi:ABC transporter substrate-binding protein [Paenibacillus radicis (ex Xue et al. 2023)]|uniref:Extracellular solute-binding protein n=1 Tax=Paenibacillus radicis (ex Xue et al. 2023) TaxID=2972489 RepID=A0ABT1YIX8_9BACL|nr:extracellular solute-binding protein [Paenibacillus radicis (ex Xue et al. 2023)]MCR8633142.1 extracellular solute-binding protein [Paenibacillus radicis (ex Xue et al. 2023)]